MKKESACAACKYQRQRCKPDCPLAPYFPGHDSRRFLIMNRLYGQSNLLKALMNWQTQEERDEMMRCRHFEAMAWDSDPVRGAAGMVFHLENEIRILNLCLAAAAQGGTALDNPPASIDGSSCVVGNPAGAHDAAPPGIFSSGAADSRYNQNPNPADAYVASLRIFSSGAGDSRYDQNPNPADANVAPQRIFSRGASSSRNSGEPNLGLSLSEFPTGGSSTARGIVIGGGNDARAGQNPVESRAQPAKFYGGVGLQDGQDPAAGIHVAQAQPDDMHSGVDDCDSEMTRSD